MGKVLQFERKPETLRLDPSKPNLAKEEVDITSILKQFDRDEILKELETDDEE